MSLPVHPKSGPINRAAFLSGLGGTAAWDFWPMADSGILQMVTAGLCLAVAFPSGIRTAVLLVKDYKLRRDLARAAEASSDHGTAREAGWHELVARGMDRPASGNLLGLHRHDDAALPVFTPPKTPFALIEMPPGVGKTVNYVIGSVLHQARLGKSLFIPDVKAELAPMLMGALKALRIEVWCVNPAKLHMKVCGDTELNLYQAVLDACHDEGDFRKDAIKLALDLADLHLPEPSGGEDKNIFFRNGSRRCLVVGILSQAILDPAGCTPSDVFALLNDPSQFRKRLVQLRHQLPKMRPDDPIVAFLKSEAASLLDLIQNNAENAQSFIEGATQRLIAFNQGGRMAGYGRTASVNIAAMRERQIAVFVMAPLSHARDFAPVVSLLNHSLLEVAKRNPAGHPVHIVGEEALNFRFSNLASDMETMRGLKISADLYIQSFDGLIRKYGRDTANAIEAYSDVRIYAGLNSYHRAKHVSDMLAEATIRRQDYSYKADVADIGVSSRELGRKLMTPDEILAMDRGDAWVFVRGLRPMRLAMIDYGRVAPWRNEVADNPLEGTRLRGEAAFTIRYADKNAEQPEPPTIEGVAYPSAIPAKRKRRMTPPVRLRHLAWVPFVVAVMFTDLTALPTPHVRLTATYSGPDSARLYHRCDYVGLHARTVTPPDGRCPVVTFFPAH